MSNSSLTQLKSETRKLLSEIASSESQFAQHAKSILSRYGSDPELVEELKTMMSDILAAYHADGLNGVDSISKNSYSPDLASVVNWMKGKAKSDIRNKVELPGSMDEIMHHVDQAHASKLAAAKKAQEEREAKQKAEEERKAALSPEERTKEDELEKAKREWNNLMAIYGGEENYRAGRGLGS